LFPFTDVHWKNGKSTKSDNFKAANRPKILPEGKKAEIILSAAFCGARLKVFFRRKSPFAEFGKRKKYHCAF